MLKKEKSIECFRTHPNLIRPANYDDALPGQGYYRFQKHNLWYTVINLGGQVFFEKQFTGTIKNPFLTVDEILAEVPQKGDIILVDLHAEATSEKIAMGRFLDGRVSAVFGTHTHVQTADEKIFPHGTGYITDLGMTGPQDSVIGRRHDAIVEHFLTLMPKKFEVADKDVELQGAIVNIDDESGKCLSIERIREKLENY